MALFFIASKKPLRPSLMSMSDFVNHSCDYIQIWTPLGPITIINNMPVSEMVLISFVQDTVHISPLLVISNNYKDPASKL